MGKKTDEPEIVASHGALNVVSGWLGVSPEEALEDEGNEEDASQVRRPAFLGLGAKYLAHHKAIGIAAELDVKLKRRLEAGRKRTAAQATEEAAAAQGRTPSQQQAQQNGNSDCDDDDEEEDKYKARQVKQRQVIPKQAWQAPTNGVLHGKHSSQSQPASSQADGGSQHQSKSDRRPAVPALNGAGSHVAANGQAAISTQGLEGLSKSQKKRLRKKMKSTADAQPGSLT